MEDILLNNHLAFLSSHRGKVVRGGDTIFIESDRPEFTYAILTKSADLTALSRRTKTVQLFPSSKITGGDLTKAGFGPATGLSYMVLGRMGVPGICETISPLPVCRTRPRWISSPRCRVAGSTKQRNHL